MRNAPVARFRREPERAGGERGGRREAPGESRHPLQRYLVARRAGRYLCFVTGLEPERGSAVEKRAGGAF